MVAEHADANVRERDAEQHGLTSDGRFGRMASNLERQPEQQALRYIAQESGRTRDIVGGLAPAALDPLDESAHVAAFVERHHQFEVEEEATRVEVCEIGRAHV